MQLFSARARFYATLLAILPPLVVAAYGCGRGRKPAAFRHTCGDIPIKVNHNEKHGVDKKAVYRCTGDTITWKSDSSDIQSFEVEFVGDDDDLPFGTSPKIFDSDSNGKAITPKLPDPGQLTVFKYKITITDKQGGKHQFDPHVVGGGG